MSGSTRAVIFSHPSRSLLRAQTLLRLMSRTTRAVPEPLVWTGDGAPCQLPAAECCGMLRGQRQRDIHDFRALIASPELDGRALLFLEDDVDPCINALPYMLEWECPPPRTITSFYNPYRTYGKHTAFIFSQAFKVPAELVARMRAEPFPAPLQTLQRDGIDQVIHRYLARWRLPFYQHRSVVEHIGEVSTWDVRLTLDERGRRSIDWPGPDFDAYQLVPRQRV